MIVVPYKPEHLVSMVLQPSQTYLQRFITPEVAATVATHPAFTGLVGEKVIGCAGVINVWEGRGIAWAYLARDAGTYMPAITKAVKRFLEASPLRRIEMNVDLEFEQGHRWANMLGFRLEAGRMEAYRPDGGTCSLYARVRK